LFSAENFSREDLALQAYDEVMSMSDEEFDSLGDDFAVFKNPIRFKNRKIGRASKEWRDLRKVHPGMSDKEIALKVNRLSRKKYSEKSRKEGWDDKLRLNDKIEAMERVSSPRTIRLI
jgi:hypothetical protein